MIVTNELKLPQPFVSAATREYEYTTKRYSVTSLLKGTKECILTRRHDEEIEVDVAESVWMIFGSAVHSILEAAQESPNQLKENKIEVEIANGYTLSGIFDLYDDSTGTVTDYKTASVWKHIYNDWKDYREQVLVYCWMLRQIGFDAHRGNVVALFKDHSKTKASRDSSWPRHPVQSYSWDFNENDFARIGAFVHAKMAELAEAECEPDDAIPPCTAEERWEKPSKFALMKYGRKSAVKLYDTAEEAEDALQGLPAGHYIEHRQGEPVKCTTYCACREFCCFYKSLGVE